MYLDPGSGSVVLQIILATLLGAGVILRLSWGKIKSLIIKKPLEKAQGEDKIDNGDESI